MEPGINTSEFKGLIITLILAIVNSLGWLPVPIPENVMLGAFGASGLYTVGRSYRKARSV